MEHLLSTKFYIPPARLKLVSRPRLVTRINEGLHRKLTLIAAPAGFGKTTLLSEWVEQSRLDDQNEYKIGWLSLDESDNDFVRFMSYFIEAIRHAFEDDAVLGDNALRMLQTPQSPLAETILTSLINDLTAVPEKIILILDDYHLISMSEIDDAVIFLLEHLPPQLHLMLATRVDPQLPLARLRASGQLTELRATDLRFTSAEVTEFLNNMMGLALSEEDITALETRTEGWIAGLQLAALSIQGSEDRSSLIKSFTGSHHLVLDYLVEEVIEKQSENMRNFLLQTAILNRLSGALCDAITSQENSQEKLEALERSNLFIVPLDNDRRWYRYHHLFRDLLRGRLQTEYPDQIPELHCRAARWYEQEGIGWGAVEHALKAKDYDLAADILERLGKHLGLWSNIEVGALLRWIKTIPRDIVKNRPWLRLYAARAYAHVGQFDKAELGLRELEELLESNPDAVEDSELMLQRIMGNQAVYASFQGQCKKAISIAQKTLKRASEANVAAQTRASRALGYAYTHLGNITQANHAFQQSINKSISVKVWSSVVSGMYQLASLQIIQGKLRQANQTCQDARQWSHIDGKRIPADGLLSLPYGEILYEQNQLERAEKLLQGDLRFLGQNKITDYFGSGYALLARIKQGLGDDAGALNLMQQARYIAEASNLELYISKILASQAQIWLSQGKITQATRWAQDFQQTEETEYLKEYEELVFVRVLLANNQPDEALQILDSVISPADEAGRMGRVIVMLMLQALAHQAHGDIDQAIISLEKALTLAKTEGFIRTFVDEGPPMAKLLYEALEHGIATNYVSQLIASIDVSEPKEIAAATKHLQSGELIEPLTKREIEVLELIAEGFSNQDIAKRLVLSLNTVKVHTRNIFSKLDVSNRINAVTRAREIGILISD